MRPKTKEKSACAELAMAYRRPGKLETASEMLSTLNKLNEQDREEAEHRKHLQTVTETPPSRESP